ncbi:MAG: DMT family transporter [Clostridia bacterium]|nr:DMT family transporter [Clostridia bacterium]
MTNKNLKGTLILLLTAFIWGSAFVAQTDGMNYVGPLTFLSTRFLLGGLVLLPIIIYKRNRFHPSVQGNSTLWKEVKKALPGSVFCGLFLGTASALQQYGLLFTSVSKAGFITTLYVIFVPIFSLFLKKKLGVNLWIAVILATVGLYLLCMNGSAAFSLGDTLVFVCAVFYALQIMAIDKYVKDTDPMLLSSIQFLTVGALSLLPAIIIEQPTLSGLADAWFPIVYAGVFSSGVAYTLQVVAQKYADPTVAAITMSFESVFAVLSAAVLLNERLSFKEGMGCIIMFCAIILAQLPSGIIFGRKTGGRI